MESFSAGMRPPTDDDVPMTSDWKPLDTKEKRLAYLTEINEARERKQAHLAVCVAPPVAPHGKLDGT